MRARCEPRDRLPGAAGLGRRVLVVLAAVATLFAPTFPHAVATGAAALPVPSAGAAAAASGHATTVGAVPDNEADECPYDDDSLEQEQSAPPLIARAATFDTVRVTHPVADPSGSATAVDESLLGAVYRCNPDERGPPR